MSPKPQAYDSIEDSAEDIRAYLARLLDSPSFAASPRRRSLLAYVVDRTLAGQGDRLKAFDIALAVLGRDERFDPQNDPIVRIEFGRLRRDLDHYYEIGGKDDPIRIAVPKGHYVASFERRSAPVVPVPSGPAPLPRFAARVGWRAAAVVVLAVVAGIGSWVSWQGRADPQRAGPAVMVMPLRALAGGEGAQFLASGLTAGLITDLMRFEGMQVFAGVAGSSDSPELPPTIASGPAYLVAGEVGRDTNRADVTVRLVDAKSGEVIWSEAYERKLTTDAIFDVEKELTAAIVSRLAQNYGIIMGNAAKQLQQDRPDTLFAYDCVQRAVAYRKTFADEQYPQVRSCLEQSVQRDPSYAAAWAMLAFAHLDSIPVGEADPTARAAELRTGLQLARHAVELAPNSVVSLQALAALQYWSGEVDEAERVQRQAIALNPNNPESSALLGWRLGAQGRFQESAELLQKAVDRSVAPPPWYYADLALVRYLLGDRAAASDLAQRGTAPCCGVGYAALAITEAGVGHATEARAALDEAIRQAPLLGTDPRAFWAGFGIAAPVIDRLNEGLAAAGLRLPTAATAARAGN